jgi:subtilisin family serine protease
MRLRARRGLVLSGAVALVAAITTACGPPPPPPPTSCDGSSVAPTPQHPVDYVAVVKAGSSSAPQATSFTATSDAEKNAKVAQLENTGTVLTVEPNRVLHAQTDPPFAPAAPNYPLYTQSPPQQWGLGPQPGADFANAWNGGESGGGTTIAIVDTGVDLNHQGLVGRVTAGPDFVDGGNVTGDPYGHGTHVAGIAGDKDTLGGLGGAPNAQLLAVRVLDANGAGTDQQVYNGIVWAANNGATVINLSLGGPGCDATMQQAVAYAHDHGVVVVAAAGNDASNELFSPAGYTKDVIAVAATNQSGQLAPFSNYGGFVSIAAPGVGVVSTCAYKPQCIQGPTPTDTAYGPLSGTSMSTPFVSAAAALIKEQCGSFSPDSVKQELQNHAGPAVPGQSFHRLDASSAVAAACG